MFKEEIIGIAAAIATYIFAYYGFLEQIEFLQFISSFLAGVFTTYVFQHRLQIEGEKRKIKREDAITMRDVVYGPIFREMNEILESMELGKSPEWEITSRLKEMKTHYLFYNMKRDLKNKFYTLAEKLDKYQTIYSSTQTLVLLKIREVVEKFHDIDVGRGMGQVRLRLELVKDAIGLGSIILDEAVLQGTKPSDFIRTKKEEWGDDISIEVRVGGKSKELSDFESLYENVLSEMEGEPLFREGKKQRQALVKELEMFLGKIEEFITVQ